MIPGTDFELFAKRVYQKLENNHVIKTTNVRHNIKLKGKSGCRHQIDLYWEYKLDGKLHRTIIECKNYGSHVPIGKVRDFFGVLMDLGDANGIMVSSKGYQEGAKRFAEYYNISLKELRRPRWNESIGSITTTVQADARHCLFLIDEEWIAEHRFDLDKLRNYYASFQFEKADYWLVATHFPIATKDHIIRDSIGNRLSSIEDLEKQLPENPISGTEIVFPFKDGWVDSYHWGPVKIREVKFEYERNVQETTLNLAADDFVEAILEDALGGRTDYVPKY